MSLRDLVVDEVVSCIPLEIIQSVTLVGAIGTDVAWRVMHKHMPLHLVLAFVFSLTSFSRTNI